jgi:hypothetical protein
VWQAEDEKLRRGVAARQRVPVAVLDADDSMGTDSGLYGTFPAEAGVSLTGGPDLFSFGDSVGACPPVFVALRGCIRHSGVGELSMSFDTMERNRTAKKNKPRLDSSTGDVSGDLGLLPILPTPSLKTLRAMDYRPPEPVFSPPTTSVPVPSFSSGYADPLGEVSSTILV